MLLAVGSCVVARPGYIVNAWISASGSLNNTTFLIVQKTDVVAE